MLWSAQEMSKRFRMTIGKNVSPRAIHVFAEKLGYHMKRIGGKKGYDQSLYTALTRHLKELLDYDSQQTVKTPQKPQKQSNLGDYYTYNGERDNIDYEWEKNENRKYMHNFLIEGVETINNLDAAVNIIQTQWSSPDDYWYVKILQRQKDNDKVVDDEGNPIFVNDKPWLDGDASDNRIGYAIIKGNTMEEAVNSLLNATITIFDSWIDFIGTKHVSSNDGNIGAIIEVCRAFNARAYMSSYKRSFDSFKDREPKKTGVMPSAILSLAGKTDPSSRERVFDHLTNHQRIGSNPYYLVDCDDEDENIHNKVLSFLKTDYNIKPLNIYHTHNGIHFLIDLSKAVRQKDNVAVTNVTVMNDFANEINYYFKTLYGNEAKIRKGTKRKQENPIELEHDKPIILYSEVGIQGRNVAHPEWQTYRNYPNKESRIGKSVKTSSPKSKVVKATKKVKSAPKQMFVLNLTNKDGKTNVFKCDASSKESVINALKERFPKWPDSIIMNHVNNKSNYVMESKTIKTIISEVLNEFIKREVI